MRNIGATLSLKDNNFFATVKSATTATGSLKTALTGATSTLKSHGSQASKTGDTLKSLAKSALGLVAAYMSFNTVKNFLTDCITAANEQAAAEKRLQTTMMNVAGTTQAQVDAVKAYAAELQKTTTVGDEAAISGASQLATFQLQGDTIKTLMPALEDLAVAQYGVSVSGDQMQSMANLMGKVMTGNTSALSRYGVVMDDAQKKILQTGTESEKAAMLVEVLGQNFGGLAEAMANTPEGRIQQLKNAWGDMQEVIGTKLYPILTQFLTYVTSKLPAIQSALETVVNAVMPIVQGLFTQMTASIEAVLPIEHYTEYIKNNPAWEFAGIFADEGITGTNTKKRVEFNRMIDECMAGNIDMIITKSISRFARNTLDCLKYIRQLKAKNIPVFFEKESINTMDSKGEVLLTIMASLAQQESQSLSKNVKMGLQYRFQQGQVYVNHNRFLGYTKDASGNLVIVPEQAEIVRRIYQEYLEGLSIKKIAAGLEADGILTGAGLPRWHSSTVNKILRNEKYIGDALLQKTYTTDYLYKKRINNNGIVPQYYVEGSHEAIIPKDVFLLVQEELARRRMVPAGESGKRRCYSSNHCFSQIVFCNECGELFRRVHWNNRGCKSIVWRCVSRLENTGHACRARTVNEEILQSAALRAINQVLCDKDDFLKALQTNIATVITQGDTPSPEVIDKRLRELQKELLNKANHKDDYDAVAEEILRLRDLRKQAEVDSVVKDEQLKQINDLQDFIRQQPATITEFDETLVRRLIAEITVFSKSFTVEFKSGVKVNIKG